MSAESSSSDGTTNGEESTSVAMTNSEESSLGGTTNGEDALLNGTTNLQESSSAQYPSSPSIGSEAMGQQHSAEPAGNESGNLGDSDSTILRALEVDDEHSIPSVSGDEALSDECAIEESEEEPGASLASGDSEEEPACETEIDTAPSSSDPMETEAGTSSEPAKDSADRGDEAAQDTSKTEGVNELSEGSRAKDSSSSGDGASEDTTRTENSKELSEERHAEDSSESGEAPEATPKTEDSKPVAMKKTKRIRDSLPSTPDTGTSAAIFHSLRSFFSTYPKTNSFYVFKERWWICIKEQ
uniref:DMP1 n=1 Tax=Steinernema glaseri TaxID=37863 RepID=A0A1I7YK00_9BILA